MAQPDTDRRRRLLACVHVKKDGGWQKHRKIPGSLPEKAADSGFPAGALCRWRDAELSLPRPQYGRAGHRDADAAGNRGASETAHPGEVLPDGEVFWLSGQPGAWRKAAAGVPNVSFKTFTRGEIAHLVIDSTGLKVFGEGEWKVKKHGKERRRIWRKLHLAVDSNTHEIICADLSLNNVTDSEAFPGLIRQTHRKIRAASADGAYDTRLCHDELRRKKISALIPPRKGAGYWPGEYADRNRAVANRKRRLSTVWQILIFLRG